MLTNQTRITLSRQAVFNLMKRKRPAPAGVTRVFLLLIRNAS